MSFHKAWSKLESQPITLPLRISSGYNVIWMFQSGFSYMLFNLFSMNSVSSLYLNIRCEQFTGFLNRKSLVTMLDSFFFLMFSGVINGSLAIALKRLLKLVIAQLGFLFRLISYWAPLSKNSLPLLNNNNNNLLIYNYLSIFLRKKLIQFINTNIILKNYTIYFDIHLSFDQN